MFSKKNKKMIAQNHVDKKLTYSLRKFNRSAGSVLIGAFLLFASYTGVSAQELMEEPYKGIVNPNWKEYDDAAPEHVEKDPMTLPLTAEESPAESRKVVIDFASFNELKSSGRDVDLESIEFTEVELNNNTNIGEYFKSEPEREEYKELKSSGIVSSPLLVPKDWPFYGPNAIEFTNVVLKPCTKIGAYVIRELEDTPTPQVYKDENNGIVDQDKMKKEMDREDENKNFNFP